MPCCIAPSESEVTSHALIADDTRLYLTVRPADSASVEWSACATDAVPDVDRPLGIRPEAGLEDVDDDARNWAIDRIIVERGDLRFTLYARCLGFTGAGRDVVASDFRVAETDSTLLYLSAVTHLGEGELPFNLVAAWEMTGTESRRVFVGSHPRPWVPTHVAGLARDTYTPSQPAETELAPLAPAPSTAPSGEPPCIEWAEDADRAFNVAYFRPGDTTLTEASTESLKENVNRIGTCPAWCVKVRGQSIPIEEDGLARAAARADAVRTFYARQDVEPGRVLGMATVADVYDPYRIHSEPTTSRSDLRVTTEFWPCPAPTE